MVDDLAEGYNEHTVDIPVIRFVVIGRCHVVVVVHVVVVIVRLTTGSVGSFHARLLVFFDWLVCRGALLRFDELPNVPNEKVVGMFCARRTLLFLRCGQIVSE